MSAMLGIMRTVIRVFFISVLTMKLLELEISSVSRISNGYCFHFYILRGSSPELPPNVRRDIVVT